MFTNSTKPLTKPLTDPANSLSNDSFAKELNPPQLMAVNKVDGPLLILAGAGSGKTRVLTYRMAQILLQQKANPEQILAVTFTNKAAKEMESRTLSLLAKINVPVYDRMWISTFHSICSRILREYLHLLHYNPGWGIYDSGDQLSMIKRILNSMGIKDKEFPAKGVQGRINNAKMLGILPHQVEKHQHFLMDKKTLEIFFTYEESMKKANSLDFGDLLLKTHLLFTDYPDILKLFQNRFRYIMIDEYQDTNHIQYLLIKKLAEKHHNICVVGDEDQSIYSWRGADISNILSFEKDFPGTLTVKLEENYRSTHNIVTAAQNLIKNNSQRKDKTLFTNNNSGDKITISEENSEYDEARFISRSILKHTQSADFNYSDISVFYRTNAQSRVIEENLRSDGIPYKMLGGMKFYERKEIKDVLSYMKLAVNPSDDIAIKRVVNVPTRGIGKTSVEKLEDFAQSRNLSLFEAIPSAIEEKLFHAGAIKKFTQFYNIICGITKDLNDSSLTEFYQELLEKTGYINRLQLEDTSEADARVDNLEEFYNAISQFENERGEEATLIKFLEEMALVSDADSMDDQANSVTLMTLHISKGLEFPCVFMVGMEENLFPSGQSVNNTDPFALEEERRLAYVGMTRAEKKLYLTHARRRKVWGAEQMNPPSRFLGELPDEFVERKSSVERPKFMNNFSNQSGSSSSVSAYNRNSHNDSFNQSPSYEDFSDEVFDSEAPLADRYKKGMQVRHPSYGVGSIFKIEGKGDTQKVSIMFTDRTVKKFVAKFARLEPVNY